MMLVPVDLMLADQVLKDKNYAIEYLRKEIAEITNCKEEEITQLDFPMGLKPLKINTRFSFDGFEMCLTGKSTGGKQLGFSSVTPLKVPTDMERYIKKIERFVEKKKENSKIVLDENHDLINSIDNGKVYAYLSSKLTNSVYQIAFGSQKDILCNGYDKFMNLSIEEQCVCLLNLISLFKTGRASGCDLSKIGGKSSAGIVLLSSKLTNWVKSYDRVRIINESASGIYRQESDNILEWL